MHSAESDPLSSPRRLADLEASGLLDSTSSAALDALTEVASRSLGTGTTALVNAVTADRQITVSLAAEGETQRPGLSVPLSQSMCKYVVLSGRPEIVPDAAADPRHARVVRDFGTGAYAGFPLRGARGTVIGALCTVTARPRQWSPQDLGILQSVATAAESVVAMGTAARQARMARIAGAVPTDPSARFQHDLRTPLTSVIGYLDLVLDGTLGEVTPAQATALRRCQTNAERLRAVVEALP